MYALKYTLTFASLRGRSYRLEIEENDFAGEPVELTGSPAPFTVSIDDDNFIYKPLRLSTATLQLVGGSELQQLFATGWQQYRVTLVDITTTARTVWCGFIRPEEYTQDYTGGLQTMDIEAQSAISVLEQIPYTKASAQLGFVSLRSLIGRAIVEAKARYGHVYIPHTFSIDLEAYGENALLRADCQISEQNFFNEEGVPMNWLEVLEEICRFAHLTLCDWQGDLWLSDYDYTDAYDQYAADAALTLTQANAITPARQSVQAIGYHGSAHTLDLLGGYNKATIKVSNYSAASQSNSNIILPNDDLSTLPVAKSWEVDGEWTGRNDGNYFAIRRRCASKWLRGVQWKTHVYKGTGKYTDGSKIYYGGMMGEPDGSKREAVTELDASTAQDTRAQFGGFKGYKFVVPKYYGAFFIRTASIDYKSQGTYDAEQGKVVYPDNELVDSTWNWRNWIVIAGINDSQGKKAYDPAKTIRMEEKPLLEFANATPEVTYPDGWVKIQMEAVNEECYDIGWSPANAYVWCLLRIGEKWWNGSSWQSTGCGFTIQLDEHGKAPKRATPEEMARLGEVDCFAVPILERLQGTAQFIIYGASVTMTLTKLSISYDVIKKSGSSTSSDDGGDRIYTNEVNADFINEMDEIEAKISSFNNDGACFSKVMLNGNYIENHIYEGITHRYVRPEEFLLRRIINQYEVSKVKLSQELRYTPELLPATIITDKTRPGARFVQTGGEIDFAGDTANVQMITFEE